MQSKSKSQQFQALELTKSARRNAVYWNKSNKQSHENKNVDFQKK